MDFVEYKCPCCGAPLHFSGEDQKLSCRNCDNTYELATLQALNDAEQKGEEQELNWEFQKEAQTAKKTEDGKYICPSCGAEIDADENTVSTKCPYCENVVVIKATASGIFQPDFVIPFQVDADDARQRMEQFCKGKKLLPKNFRDKSYLKNLKGYYVPYWLFDCDANVSMNFTGTKTRFWSDGNYDYTDTSYFLINREGEMSFRHIPVDGSIDMEDETTESIEPFDYRGLKEFNPAYLAGYETNRYDVDAKTAEKRAKERLYNSAEQMMKDTVRGYDTIVAKNRNLNSRSGKINYVLLPVWLFETVYDQKKYQFAINGQTGKMVGELPVDKGAFWRNVWKYTGIATVVWTVLILLF